MCVYPWSLAFASPLADWLQEIRFDISESTSFQDFTDLLKKDSRTAQYDHDTATLLFDRVSRVCLLCSVYGD